MHSHFLVHLLEDVVISKRSATVDADAGLDILPGAVFLGAVAARLYGKLEPSEQLAVFHQGSVHFGDALPISNKGHPFFPVPLCWHRRKSDPPCSRTVLNYQLTEHGEEQPVQCRDEFFNRFGEFLKPYRSTRMKTGVEFARGTAATGQLFGLSSLPRGSHFYFRLAADDETISRALFRRLVAELDRELYLGRSRSAEYGRVQVSMLPPEASDDLDPPPPGQADGIDIWLLSDACLQDAHGQPLLYPSAADAGLPPSFQLDLAKTFIRSRTYAPFNGTRKRRELERQVLCKGSVLHFTVPDGQEVNEDTLNQLQNRGIGLYRQYGLGRIWINPIWLKDPEPSFDSSRSPDFRRNRPPVLQIPDGIPSLPEDPVYRYLNQRSQRYDYRVQLDAIERQWVRELREVYRSARTLEPYLTGICIGPSRTQWSRVMEAAKGAKDAKELERVLFEGNRAICKEHDTAWAKQVYLGPDTAQTDSFHAWLKSKIRAHDQKKPPPLPAIIARFARAAMDIAEQDGCNRQEDVTP